MARDQTRLMIRGVVLANARSTQLLLCDFGSTIGFYIYFFTERETQLSWLWKLTLMDNETPAA